MLSVFLSNGDSPAQFFPRSRKAAPVVGSPFLGSDKSLSGKTGPEWESFGNVDIAPDSVQFGRMQSQPNWVDTDLRASSETAEMSRRWAGRSLAQGIIGLFLAESAVGCCMKDKSVESTIADNRKEIVAYVEELRTISSKLGSAPSSGTSLAGVQLNYSNTIVLAQEDIPGLQTNVVDFQERFPWTNASSARPYSDYRIAAIIDALRSKPLNPPEKLKSKVEALERDIGTMKSSRYVAVTRTASGKAVKVSHSYFDNGEWKGSVVVWDRTKSVWIGALTLEVTDSRTTTKSGASDPSDELTRTLNRHITRTVEKSLHESRSIPGVLRSANSTP